MKPSTYNQRFYTTPHYSAADTAAVFAVRLMPLTARPAHALGNYAGLRRRFGGSAMLRSQNQFNRS